MYAFPDRPLRPVGPTGHFFAIFGYQANPKPSFMKKSLVLLLLSSLVSGLYARQPRTVVEPPFAFRSSGTLEIERIELAPESTTVYIQAYFRPHNWIRISSETYIRTGAEGEKLTVRSADGMPLDTEFYMPETGRHDFSLSFPPVDPKTAKIDLIESDCPDCFKIYDIDLTGKKAKPGRSALAKKYKKAAPLTENFTAPVVSDSPARIAGAITGYDPRFFDRIEIAFSLRSSGTERPNSPCPSGRTDRSKRG